MAKSKKAQPSSNTISPSKKKKKQKPPSKPKPALEKPEVTGTQIPAPTLEEASRHLAGTSTERTPQRCNGFDREFLFDLRKRISLLFMLTDSPSDPAPNSQPVEKMIEDQALTRRELSFDCELALVEAFTFISSATVDPSRVSALCLEEVRSIARTTFILKLSANNGDSSCLKSGLETIIADLAIVSSDVQDSSSNTDRVLRSIVTLNLPRLLCRLRSRHAVWTKSNFTKSKRAKPLLLPQVMQSFRRSLATDARLAYLEAQVDHLEGLSESLEALSEVRSKDPKNKAISLLVQILKTIHFLWLDDTFQELFRDGNHSFLLLALAKLARYVSASCFLIEKFRAVSCLVSMKVEVIKLSPISLPVYQWVPGGFQTFVSTLTSETNGDDLLKQASKSSRSASGTKSSTNCDDTFADIVNVECPVHAEIQLLFHYELNSTLVRPRLILSTKRPCFLCSLFFRLHGKFYTAHSHGRLYEKWALPQTLDMLSEERKSTINTTIQSFSDNLTQCVKDAALPTKKVKLMSLESLFRGSAIWALAKRSSPAGSMRNMMTNVRSKTPLSRVFAGSIHSASSHETAKPSKGLSSAHSSQDTIRASTGGAAIQSTSDLIVNDLELNPTLLQDFQCPEITSSSQQIIEPFANIQIQSTLTLKTPTILTPNPSHPHHLHRGSSIVLDLRPPPETTTATAAPTQNPTTTLHTTSLHLHLTLATSTASYSSMPPGPTYAALTNLDPIPSTPITDQPHRQIPTVDISTLKPGVDIDIDLSSTGGGRSGIVLRSSHEKVLLRWGERETFIPTPTP